MKKDLISIIIPSYNTGEIIINTLDCIKNQTINNYEVIIVDDGSKDDTGNIIKNYIKNNKLDNFKYFYKDNGGVSSARNYGIEKSNGEYILFLDSDDLFDKDLLKELYNSIKDNNSDLSVCNLYIIQNNIKHSGRMNINIKNTDILPYKSSVFNDEYAIKNYNFNYEFARMSCSKIFKSEIIKNNNILFDCNIHNNEDGFFNLMYLKYVKSISYVNKELYIYLRDNGHSGDFRSNLIEENRYKINTMYDYVLNNEKDILLSLQTYIIVIYSTFIENYVTNKNNNLSFKDRKNLLKNEYNNLYKNKITYKSLKYLNNKRKLLFILTKLHLFGLIIKLYELRKKA